jgi:putative exosortase-associated protein (TIGR04073 family)
MAVKRILCAFLFCWTIVLAKGGVAGADSDRTVENSTPQEVVDGMMIKAGRGLANMTTGWLEFPKQIYTTSKEDGTAMGIFIGPLKGLGMTVVRTIAGVGEFATFYCAYPGFYDPFFDPAYVWQKE